MPIVLREDTLDAALLGDVRRELKLTEHLNHALDMIRPKLTDYAPKLAPNQHLHVCGCGDFLVCTHDPDKCQVMEPFTCVGCAMEQQEQHLNQMERNESNR